MFRSILGFAVLAVAVWLVLQIAFGLLGTLFGLAITMLWLGAIGYVLYLILRFFSPSTAAKVRDMIRGGQGTVV
jgi:hypothetical protein